MKEGGTANPCVPMRVHVDLANGFPGNQCGSAEILKRVEGGSFGLQESASLSRVSRISWHPIANIHPSVCSGLAVAQIPSEAQPIILPKLVQYSYCTERWQLWSTQPSPIFTLLSFAGPLNLLFSVSKFSH